MRLKKDVGDFFKPENPKDSGISECILKKLNSVLGNDINKLVSQTYDGASIMSVKMKVRRVNFRENTIGHGLFIAMHTKLILLSCCFESW